MNNRSVPVSGVLPHMAYADLPAAVLWLEKVFGFREHFRYGEPVAGVQMQLGEACFMIVQTKPTLESPLRTGVSTQMVTVIVDDVDAQYTRVLSAGAQVWEELGETVYGERQFGVSDLEGHRWLFAQHVRDVSPQEWGANVASG
jgi:uncharacterized glyoxalase superfamily protein PhnB